MGIMLDTKDIKKITTLGRNDYKQKTLESVVHLAQLVNQVLIKKHRYSCGLESLEISTNKWSYRGIEQPNPKAHGFFNSPDGQNGEFYWALRDAGFAHHFRMAEYHWGVRMGKIILTYTEGDVDIFEEPVGYKSPNS
jgi:hypothetical protein